MSDKDICVAKIGTPDVARGMKTCGLECEYLTAEQTERRGWGRFSGWYHSERVNTDHHAVPKRMIG